MRWSRSTGFPLRLATLVAMLLAFAAIPAVASAADRYVAPDGVDDGECLDDADPCQTIQYAVDVSDSDDTVNVAAGTYNESVVVQLPLTIVGAFDCGCPGFPGDPGDEPDDSERGGPGEARIVGVGGAPAVEVIAEDVSLVGLAFGPAAGPASGAGVQFRSGAAGGAVGFSLFEHTEEGLQLDGVEGVQVFFNVFRDHDAVAGRAIIGNGDDGSLILGNLFRRNTRAVELNESANAGVAENLSRDDGMFVVSGLTDATTIWFNDVRRVTQAGITLSGDAEADIEGNSISGDGSGLRLYPSSGTQVTDPNIEINDFHDLGGNGVRVADGAVDQVALTGNRFFATGQAGLLVEGPDATVDATDNWWGCNEGPNQDGCDDFSAPDGATIDADPWTVMTLEADDAAISTGGDWTTVTALFNTNSDGDDIFPQGIADDLDVAFSTNLGTVDPEEDCTCGGESLTDLTSGDQPGTATVTATLDSASVTTQVDFLGPWARIAPDGFDFGSVAFGGFSPLQKFTVKNTGNENLDISGVSIGGLNPPDFQLSQDGCTGQLLAPDAFCSVKVRFVPVGSPDGPREVTLVVESNVPAGSTEVTLAGTAVGSSVLRVTPDPFSFGEIPVGSVSSQQKFIARNIDIADVTIDAVDIAGADPSQFQKTADTCTGQTIAPGATCFVRGRFTPTSAGEKTATLEFDSESITVATAQVSGTGAAIPGVRITPATFSFGDIVVGQQSPNQKWTVKNIGGTTITVESVDLTGGDVAQFQRNATTCGNVQLAPGEFCTVKVRFRPTGTPGPRSTQLVVTSDVPGTHAADLTGNAVGL